MGDNSVWKYLRNGVAQSWKTTRATEIWNFLCQRLTPTLPITEDWKFSIFCCLLSFLFPACWSHTVFPAWPSQLLSPFHSFGHSLVTTLHWGFCKSLLTAALFSAQVRGPPWPPSGWALPHKRILQSGGTCHWEAKPWLLHHYRNTTIQTLEFLVQIVLSLLPETVQASSWGPSSQQSLLGPCI